MIWLFRKWIRSRNFNRRENMALGYSNIINSCYHGIAPLSKSTNYVTWWKKIISKLSDNWYVCILCLLYVKLWHEIKFLNFFLIIEFCLTWCVGFPELSTVISPLCFLHRIVVSCIYLFWCSFGLCTLLAQSLLSDMKFWTCYFDILCWVI